MLSLCLCSVFSIRTGHVLKGNVVRARLFAMLCWVFFSSSLSASLTPVDGVVSVTEGGGLGYRLPLHVPPGVTGMAPNLALTYSGPAVRGVVGVGWVVEGISVITRCPSTKAQDGYLRGVEFKVVSDHYCLDGQRLVLIAGVEGLALAEYRLERDVFTKVTAYSDPSVTEGPARFVVRTKAGLVMEYGATSNSRLMLDGISAASAWAVEQITDLNGNMTSFSYLSVPGSLVPVVSTISYSARSGGGVVVNFLYSETDPVVSKYSQGYKFSESRRLDSISCADGTTSGCGSWNLVYAVRPSDFSQERLVSVGYCLGGECVSSNFDWQFGYAQTEEYVDMGQIAPATTGYLGQYWNFHAGDFNGDGVTDIVGTFIGHPSGLGIRFKSFISDGLGGFSEKVIQTPTSTGYGVEAWRFHVVDVNGDGRDDLVAALIGDSEGSRGIRLQSFLSNGDGTFTLGLTTTPQTSGYSSQRWAFHTGDVNGDGLVDFIATYIGESGGAGIRIQAFISNGDGSFTSGTYNIAASSGYGWPGWRFHVAEVNGDGRADLVAAMIGDNTVNVGIRLIAFVSNGDGTYVMKPAFTGPTSGYNNPEWKFQISDVNGDGLDDFTATFIGDSRSIGIRFHSFFSKGNGDFVAGDYQVFSPTGYGPKAWRFVSSDVNQDGFADMVAILIGDAEGSRGVALMTLYSNGKGMFQLPANGYVYRPFTSGYSNPAYDMYAGDFNGDGVLDFCAGLIGSSGGSGIRLQNFLSNRRVPALTSATPVGGKQFAVEYASLTHSSIYTKGTDGMFPVINVSPPGLVVRRLSLNNGLGDWTDTLFRYGGLRIELGTGRGSLGFEWSEREYVGTGVVSRTWYRQDWPFTGLISKVERGTSAATR